ncbi:MAG TPA: Sec-independent protein translocase protein TatB [Actinomycetales bacterium]|nr:Sec-independent protein translocase protein TatB [Actinomycetales bacterium]
MLLDRSAVTGDDGDVLDINGGELLVLAAVGVIVLGPERLPQYAAQLGKLVRQARGFAKSARAQMREELGEDFEDIDWQSLDPRRYDPRRIVREALLEDDDEPVRRTPRQADASTGSTDDAAVELTKPSSPTSGFDPDAT